MERAFQSSRSAAVSAALATKSAMLQAKHATEPAQLKAQEALTPTYRKAEEALRPAATAAMSATRRADEVAMPRVVKVLEAIPPALCMARREETFGACGALAADSISGAIFWLLAASFSISTHLGPLTMAAGSFGVIGSLLVLVAAMFERARPILFGVHFELLAWLLTFIDFIILWVGWGKWIRWRVTVPSDDPVAPEWAFSYTMMNLSLLLSGWWICKVQFSLYRRLKIGYSGWNSREANRFPRRLPKL